MERCLACEADSVGTVERCLIGGARFPSHCRHTAGPNGFKSRSDRLRLRSRRAVAQRWATARRVLRPTAQILIQYRSALLSLLRDSGASPQRHQPHRPRKRGQRSTGGDPHLRKSVSICGSLLFASIRVYSRFLLLLLIFGQVGEPIVGY